MSDLSTCPARSESFAAFDLIAAQVCVLDQEGTIRFVNHGWNEFADRNGYAGPAFVGQSYLDVCGASAGTEQTMAETFAVRLRKVLSGEDGQFSLTYPCHCTTAKRWFKASVRASGQGAVIMHTDISAEYLRLEDAARLLSSAKVVHDLRSPLHTIIGYADLARSQGGAKLEPRPHLEYFDIIRDAGHRMLEVVEGILDYVVEVRRDALPREAAIDIAELAHEVLRQLRPQAEAMRVALSPPSGSVPPLVADEGKLWKALTNLVSNAIKYNRPGGEIEVRVGVNASHGVEVVVRDNGIGIPADRLEAMFEPFTRGNRMVGKGAPEGTGIGLAVVREIADQHDALIRASSEVDKGTSIALVFPTWRTR